MAGNMNKYLLESPTIVTNEDEDDKGTILLVVLLYPYLL